MPTHTATILGRLPSLPLVVLATFVAQVRARERREQALAALIECRDDQPATQWAAASGHA